MPYHSKSLAVKPDDLHGEKNGQLPLSVFSNVPNGLLHHLAADAWLAMCSAAIEEKIVLAPSSAGDTYRTRESQVAGFKAHYTTVPNGNPSKNWDGKKWYLKPGQLEAATPGTSIHGWGLAVDIANFWLQNENPTTPKEMWVLENYERFGFAHQHRDPTADPPHIHYIAADEVPPAVSGINRRRKRKRFEFPPFNPEFGEFSLFPLATNKPRLALGDSGDVVRYAQGVLRTKLGYNLEINGTFDERFRDYVVWFQTENALEHDGRIGKDTWAALDAIALA
jgi:hypothetical protein